MFRWFNDLDRILRGEATRPGDIDQAEIRIPLFGISFVVLLLGIFYGFCMGVFALIRGIENKVVDETYMYTIASMCKVPMLFLLTLVITFPSLYVFNALVGSQLKVKSVLKLLIASLGVNMAVLASLGPIVIFFSVSTPNYPFILLLNVVVFTVSGILGVIFLVQTLNRLTEVKRGNIHVPNAKADWRAKPADKEGIASSASIQVTDHPAAPVTGALDAICELKEGPGPLDKIEGVALGRHVKKIFACWIIVFGLVGAQMGWVLRPFIGSPNAPFEWFRERNSNFFQAVWQTIQNVFSTY